jgi:hypothetical protein
MRAQNHIVKQLTTQHTYTDVTVRADCKERREVTSDVAQQAA